ncbi:hypothetical protein [Curtobacterium sp. 9128]|uniref:hypothetical protein n=1 Tax=Curtobacterium sp. 9128 TaxID=1793722 RepID=UPI0011AA6D6C|nr:hypothetical protein [Curtobacterium sp. 9128]
MQITTRAAKTGTLALVVIGLAAGVVHGLPEPADVTIEPTVERDPGAWSMPLDAYAVPAGAKTSYAEDLVVEPCLREVGIDDPPPWATAAGLQADDDASDTAARANPSPALATTRPLTAALAETRGYHGPSTDGANREGMRAWAFDPDRNAAFAALSPSQQAAVDRCWHDARKALGSGESGAEQTASDLAQRLTHLAAVDARSDESVVRAAAKWRTCMRPAGVTDLPDAPEGMPTTSMRVLGHDGSAVVVLQEEISKREVAVAERDVACQESSGYRAALYDAEWQRLLHVTASDAAALRRGSTRQPQLDARLDATIARLAPAAPDGVA